MLSSECTKLIYIYIYNIQINGCQLVRVFKVYISFTSYLHYKHGTSRNMVYTCIYIIDTPYMFIICFCIVLPVFLHLHSQVETLSPSGNWMSVSVDHWDPWDRRVSFVQFGGQKFDFLH